MSKIILQLTSTQAALTSGAILNVLKNADLDPITREIFIDLVERIEAQLSMAS